MKVFLGLVLVLSCGACIPDSGSGSGVVNLDFLPTFCEEEEMGPDAAILQDWECRRKLEKEISTCDGIQEFSDRCTLDVTQEFQTCLSPIDSHYYSCISSSTSNYDRDNCYLAKERSLAVCKNDRSNYQASCSNLVREATCILCEEYQCL